MNKRKKNTLVAVIASLLVLLVMELLTRGAFNLFGRYEGWGYSTGSNVYRPYIGFASRSYESGRDRYAFKLDSNDDLHRDLTEKDVCEFRIFMLGGSTVEGRFLSNRDDTLAARLETLLKREHPSINFQVINAGEGSYFSVQELISHLLYIGPSGQPNHIIYFNGSNDFSLWPRNELPGLGGNMNSHTNQLFKRAKSINTIKGAINLLFQRLSNWSAIIYTMHKSVNYPATIKKLTNLGNKKISLDEWIKKHLDRYFYNISLALNAANKNVPVSYFFQPTLLPETPASEKELTFMKEYFQPNGFHGYNYFDSKQKFYTRARSMIKNLKKSKENPFADIHDLSLLFFSKKNDLTVFSDHVHYLPISRKIISNSIVEIIEPKLKKQLLSQPFMSCQKNLNRIN